MTQTGERLGSMRAQRLIGALLVSLCALVGMLALSGASAQAAAIHNYLSQITEVPTSSGATFTGSLGRVDSMTLDAGQLLIAEGEEQQSRLNKFDASSGAFVTQFPHVPSLEYLDQGVAIGHSSGQVYIGADELVGGSPAGVVGVFSATGALEKVWNGADTPAGAFGCFGCGSAEGVVAVDNSTSVGDWAAGDVYVSAREQRVVDVFKPEAGGNEHYETRLAESEPGVPFELVHGVAVDQSNGDVVIAETKAIDVFEPTVLGEYAIVRRLTGPPGGAFGHLIGVAVDSGDGDVYVIDEASASVDEFSSAGIYLGSLTETPAGAFASIHSVAVDPESHKVYVGTPGAVDVFGPNLVVPDVVTGGVSPLKPESATLTGSVNPDGAGPATCEFLWGTSRSFGQVAPCSEPVANGESPVGVDAPLASLAPDTTYYYRLQASNASGTNPGTETREFTTPGPATHAQWATDVTSTSVVLSANIDPNKAPTSYYFQYGTSTGYGSDVPAPPGVDIGSGETDVEVTQHFQGLQGGSLYHYRVVAVSELAPGVFEAFDGPDATFSTQPLGGNVALPDGRAWELVSPPNKHGSILFPISLDALVESSLSGDAFTYVGDTPIDSAVAGYSYNEEQILSKRGIGGWSSENISLPHDTATGIAPVGTDYHIFSEDLSLGLADPSGEFTSLAPHVFPPDTEHTPYLRRNATCADDPATCYQPLVTGAPGYSDVPSGIKFGGAPTSPRGNVKVAGATPDLQHMIIELEERGSVTLTAPPYSNPPYEWSAGKSPAEELQSVAVMPDGSPGIGELGANGTGSRNNTENRDGSHAISGDGSRVFWTGHAIGSATQGGEEHLYVRDLSNDSTAQLDVVQPGAAGDYGVHPFFLAASVDGTIAYFSDSQRLTTNSQDVNSTDLYECMIVTTDGKDKCNLSDLTPGALGLEANLLGIVGTSDDGSWVYFVANPVLTPEAGATPGTCVRHSLTGTTCKLYVRHGGVTSVVATLSGEDEPDWSTVLLNHTARVSPDGRYLAFMSKRSLTGYDNHDAVSGQPDEEVYLFDAATGRLVCSSCDPTGARPVGEEVQESFSTINDTQAWSGHKDWIAASVPAWTRDFSSVTLYQSRYLSDSGRLFFNSSDALVPGDINNDQDVYEYEPPSVGSCTPLAATFSAGQDGCIALVSSGTELGGAGFLDASADGSDVFFLTPGRLNGKDTDTALDVYDAHTCTTGSPCPASPVALPVCTTADACRVAPLEQPSIFGSPASATFSGAGNVAPPRVTSKAKAKSLTRAQKLAVALKACRKKRITGKRAACERQARRRYQARKSVKSKATKRTQG